MDAEGNSLRVCLRPAGFKSRRVAAPAYRGPIRAIRVIRSCGCGLPAHFALPFGKNVPSCSKQRFIALNAALA